MFGCSARGGRVSCKQRVAVRYERALGGMESQAACNGESRGSDGGATPTTIGTYLRLEHAA